MVEYHWSTLIPTFPRETVFCLIRYNLYLQSEFAKKCYSLGIMALLLSTGQYTEASDYGLHCMNVPSLPLLRHRPLKQSGNQQSAGNLLEAFCMQAPFSLSTCLQYWKTSLWIYRTQHTDRDASSLTPIQHRTISVPFCLFTPSPFAKPYCQGLLSTPPSLFPFYQNQYHNRLSSQKELSTEAILCYRYRDMQYK
jgi:hypothetical protein